MLLHVITPINPLPSILYLLLCLLLSHPTSSSSPPLYSLASGRSEAELKELKVAFDRGVCVIVSLPLAPCITRLSCSLDVHKMREFWSSSVVSHHLSIFPQSTRHPSSGFQKAGISLPRGVCVGRSESVKRPAVTLSAILCFKSFFHSLTPSSLPVSLFVPPSILFPARYLKETATTTLPS